MFAYVCFSVCLFGRKISQAVTKNVHEILEEWPADYDKSIIIFLLRSGYRSRFSNF